MRTKDKSLEELQMIASSGGIPTGELTVAWAIEEIKKGIANEAFNRRLPTRYRMQSSEKSE